MFGRAILVVVAAATLLGVAAGADAHTSPAIESVTPAAVLEWAPPSASSIHQDAAATPQPSAQHWPVLLLAALAGALGPRRSRRLVAALLVVLVGVLAFEAALHSVHHGLGDEKMACPTASVAAHVHGTTSSLLATDVPILRAGHALAPSEPCVRPQRQVDSQHDRAPPSALA